MRRLYAPTVLGLILCGGLAWVFGTLTWVEATGAGDTTIEAPGSEMAPAVGALALVLCAAALGVLAAGPTLRRVIGVVIVLCATGALVAIATMDADAEAVAAATQASAVLGAELTDVSRTAWPVVTGLLLVAGAALGVVTVLGAAAWPTMGARYESPQARPPASDDDTWKQLDAGIDPTVDPGGADGDTR